VNGGNTIVAAGDTQPMPKFVVWVPCNPVLREYKTVNLGSTLFEDLKRRSQKNLYEFDEVLIDKNGYICTDMVSFVEAVMTTANVVCDKLCAMLELFRSSSA
jgi:hypothetical protein